MRKKITRRQAIKIVSGTVLLPFVGCAPQFEQGNKVVFAHGVASGDPDQNSVVIWTRISGATTPVMVDWFVATDATFKHVVSKGIFKTDSSRDHTVKIVADDLSPGQAYFYKFAVADIISPTGQTQTLPVGHIEQLVLAVTTCSNYPFGYFNAYDAIAKDASIDLVVHLGDYIYEYGVEGFGGEMGQRIGRNHQPSHEIVSLDDYRKRHAQYKTDQGSLAMHARHPLVVIWDDHETANNPWMGGAKNHQPNEGSWEARRLASLQAYYEWLPVRDPSNDSDRANYWRHYKFGDLASLITLESRHTGRSKQISYNESLPDIQSDKQAQEFAKNVINAADREMLSKEMQDFLKEELNESVSAGRRWRIIGNQSVIAKSIAPDLDDPILNNLRHKLSVEKQQKLVERTHIGKYSLPSDLDTWSGYPAARERFYQIAKDANVQDLLVISGDSHSFWQNQLFDDNGQSMGLELGATGVTSPRSIMESLGGQIMQRFDELNTANNQEIIWSDGRYLGFIRLEVNHKGTHADYITVSNVASPTYDTQILRSVDIINRDGLLQYEK
jgi:alkaline phosphatase D